MAQNGTTTVTFPTVTLPAGDNEIQYAVNTLNGSQIDLLASNNNDLNGTVSALTNTPTATTLVENFNAATLPSGTWQYSQNLPGAVLVEDLFDLYTVFDSSDLKYIWLPDIRKLIIKNRY